MSMILSIRCHGNDASMVTMTKYRTDHFAELNKQKCFCVDIYLLWHRSTLRFVFAQNVEFEHPNLRMYIYSAKRLYIKFFLSRYLVQAYSITPIVILLLVYDQSPYVPTIPVLYA